MNGIRTTLPKNVEAIEGNPLSRTGRLFPLLRPNPTNRNFHVNRFFTEISFSCLNRGLLEDHSNFPRQLIRNFVNDFVSRPLNRSRR